MKTPINIHITSLDRLLSDGLVNKKEYEDIMLRIISARLESKDVTSSG